MKYQVQYVRIEHQIYTLEVEADSPEDAEDVAEEEFSGNENYNVVHAEEYIEKVTPLQETTA